MQVCRNFVSPVYEHCLTVLLGSLVLLTFVLTESHHYYSKESVTQLAAIRLIGHFSPVQISV